MIDLNLVGTFYALQRAAKSMVKQGVKGSIINMSSVNAQVAIPAIAAYCASKGGVMQVTKAASLALASHGIRVNAVGPGSICLLYTSPSPRDKRQSRMPSSA